MIKPQLGITTRFTDNVFYGNDSVLANGQPIRAVESEVLQIVSPGMKLQYGATGLNTLSFEYNYDRIFYIIHPEFDTAQHRGLFNADLKLGRFTIKGSDSVQLLSSFLNGNNSGVSEQVDRLIWNDNYKVTYDLTAKTDVYVFGIHNAVDYDKGAGNYDSETLRGGLGATYIWTDRLRVFTEGEYGQSSINPNNTTQTKGPHSVIYGGFIGIRGNIATRFEGSLRVGYETRVFPGHFAPGQEPTSQSSPAVNFDLTYTLSEKTQFRLSYDRSSDVSPQFGKQSYIYDKVRFTVNQFLGTSGKWLTTATVGFDMGDFSKTPPPNNQARSDEIFTAGVRLIYQPRPWLAAVLAYDYEKYSTRFDNPAANAQLIDYQVNNVSLSLNIGY